MMDTASDTFHRPPKCDYAACEERATGTADGWDFCDRHLAEHPLVMAGEDLPDIPRRLLPIPCGTEGGYKMHLRRGNRPCFACAEASRVATAVRNAERYPDRWHRREAS